MYKTFEELERAAYMSNQIETAKLYTKLDDNEQADIDFENLRDKMRDLEMDSEYLQCNSEALEKKVEALENKLEKITDIINE
jgi:SMC interacting uncharacterized protein involved in chromosome segregation